MSFDLGVLGVINIRILVVKREREFGISEYA
jgi:hypothetical protein